MSKVKTENSSKLAVAASRWACFAADNEVRDFLSQSASSAEGGGAGFSYAGFGLSGNYDTSDAQSVTSDTIRRWRQNNCASSSDTDARDEFAFLSSESLSGEAIDAWRKCVTDRQGLACYAEPNGEEIRYQFSWKSSDVELPTISKFSVPADAIVKDPVQLGDTVYIGAQSITVATNGRGGYISLTINHRNRYSYTCAVKIPSVEFQRATSEFAGDYCYSPGDFLFALNFSSEDYLTLTNPPRSSPQCEACTGVEGPGTYRLRYKLIGDNDLLYWNGDQKPKLVPNRVRDNGFIGFHIGSPESISVYVARRLVIDETGPGAGYEYVKAGNYRGATAAILDQIPAVIAKTNTAAVSPYFAREFCKRQ